MGIYFVYKGQSTVGTVVYIIATGNVTIESLQEIFHVYTRIIRNLMAVVRMKELMDQDIDVKNTAKVQTLSSLKANFEFKNVTFIYPGKSEPVLKNFNLNIVPNQMVALVISSGEGKTTIARLLCRMYDVTSGSIILDGKDIQEIDLFWYRRMFAVVQQDIDIFDATFLANIAYPYPNVCTKQVIQAAQAAHLTETLNNKEKFPDGILTQVGKQGVRLSGGERQYVGIALAYLAVLNGAKILILKKATSSLDSEAERAIQEMIDKLRK